MNWFVHARCSLEVGADNTGSGSYEGGHCDHLRKGDKCAGYSGEADDFGEEIYLMCQPCYDSFLEKRKVEPTRCNDCQQEFPKNTLIRYIPYFVDGSRSEQENAKLWICQSCQGMSRHLNRVENDKAEREADEKWDQDRDDELGYDDGPDHFPEDDMQEELANSGNSSCSETVMYWSRKAVGKHCHSRPFSNGIQKVVVVDKTYYLR